MFVANAIRVVLGGEPILCEVSVALRPGTFVALVGKNGAGKSTLLRAMSGEHAIQRGEITLDGHAIHALSALDVARRRAVLPQHSDLAFDFLVEEIVSLGRAPRRGEPGAARDRCVVRAALEISGCAALFGRRYTTLSGGERARVHLARALAQIWEGDEPRYLLLDEPTASLDISHANHVLGVARSLADRGFGVMAVLHDLNAAARFADRVLVLREGVVAAEGPPRAVFRSELIEHAFDTRVHILSHPDDGGPLIVPRAFVPPAHDATGATRAALH